MPRKKPTKPTPKKRAQRGKPAAPTIDTSWHTKFLEILGSTCNVTLAAKGAGIDRTSAYDHYKTQPDFAAAWDDAKDAAVEILEAEAWQRARKTSDTLIIFLLKAHKPQMYREKIEQQVGGQLEIVVKREQRIGTTKTD
jgi:hypothetical protein